jgi:hypothetical protein
VFLLAIYEERERDAETVAAFTGRDEIHAVGPSVTGKIDRPPAVIPRTGSSDA